MGAVYNRSLDIGYKLWTLIANEKPIETQIVQEEVEKVFNRIIDKFNQGIQDSANRSECIYYHKFTIYGDDAPLVIDVSKACEKIQNVMCQKFDGVNVYYTYNSEQMNNYSINLVWSRETPTLQHIYNNLGLSTDLTSPVAIEMWKMLSGHPRSAEQIYEVLINNLIVGITNETKQMRHSYNLSWMEGIPKNTEEGKFFVNNIEGICQKVSESLSEHFGKKISVTKYSTIVPNLEGKFLSLQCTWPKDSEEDKLIRENFLTLHPDFTSQTELQMWGALAELETDPTNIFSLAIHRRIYTTKEVQEVYDRLIGNVVETVLKSVKQGNVKNIFSCGRRLPDEYCSGDFFSDNSVLICQKIVESLTSIFGCELKVVAKRDIEAEDSEFCGSHYMELIFECDLEILKRVCEELKVDKKFEEKVKPLSIYDYLNSFEISGINSENVEKLIKTFGIV